MKRFLTLFLAGMLLIAIPSCGGDSTEVPDKPNTEKPGGSGESGDDDNNNNEPGNGDNNNPDQPSDQAVFKIDGDGAYVVDDQGGVIKVKVTTNLNYTVEIPTEAKQWLSVADTRADVREETLTFTIVSNTSTEERVATVLLKSAEGEVLQSVVFKQVAAGKDPNSGDEAIFLIDGEGNYVVDDPGGVIKV